MIKKPGKMKRMGHSMTKAGMRGHTADMKKKQRSDRMANKRMMKSRY